MPKFQWTETTRAILRETRAAGEPASQAAARIGCRKSTYLDEAKRLGLPVVDPLAERKRLIFEYTEAGRSRQWIAATLDIEYDTVKTMIRRMATATVKPVPVVATHAEMYAWGRAHGVDVERKGQFNRINAARLREGERPFILAHGSKKPIPLAGGEPSPIAARVAPSVSVEGSGQPAMSLSAVPRGWNDFARFHREYGLSPFDGSVGVTNAFRKQRGWCPWNLCRGRILALAHT